jgi:hypothetical protein
MDSGQKLKDIIIQEVKRERQRRSEATPIVWHKISDKTIFDGIGRPSTWFEKASDDICTEYGLNEAQQRAFGLFVHPLKIATEKCNENTQPTMSIAWENRGIYLGGSGGTGKSRVIHALKAFFERAGCRNQLLVTATTGTAAKLIGGSTIDSLCALGRGKKKSSQGSQDDDYINGDIQRFDVDNLWTNCQFLILDDVSMVGRTKLAEILDALC